MTATEQADHIRQAAADALSRQREVTRRLLSPLSSRELHAQWHDFLSPIVWDLGHIGNFEELWLLRTLDGRPAHDPALDQLYNAFENPRWVRGELPILPADDAWTYLTHVREEVVHLLDGLDVHPDADPLTADAYVHRMIMQHESQHQETILQSLDLREEVTPMSPGRTLTPVAEVDDLARVHVAGGPFALGTDTRRWTYDNERPSHVVDVDAFDIDVHPVTNRRYAAFVSAGGYLDPTYWSERGWQWLQSDGATAPQGWLPQSSDVWQVRRLGRIQTLDPREPVQHVSHWEAEAFAAWAGGQLPTEAQWEKAASWDPTTRTKRQYPWGASEPTGAHANVGLQRFGPAPVGSFPAGASAYGVQSMAGDVYEWTSSSFEPWPGFTAFPYPEYSAVFFGGDYRVLRGSSWAIGAPMARCTYRNWDHPYRRQIFAGIRVVWPAGAQRSPQEHR